MDKTEALIESFNQYFKSMNRMFCWYVATWIAIPVFAIAFLNSNAGARLRGRQEAIVKEWTREAQSYAVRDTKFGDGVEPLTDQEWAACKSYIGNKYWYGGGLESYVQERKQAERMITGCGDN